MWGVFIFTLLSTSLVGASSASNQTECNSNDDCHEVEGLPTFCTDSGICAEGPSDKCPDNMHFSNCGTACPKTCADVLKPEDRLCIAMCVAGCFCDDGYVLDKSRNECVPEASCLKGESDEKTTQKRAAPSENATKECPENAEFSDCTNLCPDKSCGNLLFQSACFSLRCGPPGCRCKEGHVLRMAGNLSEGCVEIDTCPDFGELEKSIGKREATAEEKPQDSRCPQKAEYHECTNVCGEKNCGNILTKSDCVSLRCGPPGCQCKPGHVRLTNDTESICVRREACPKSRFRRFLKL